MAGDISRSSFQRLKGNTGVRMQQGRVQLDADWNEQLDIQAYRERTLTTDLLGSAAPIANAGFAISANGNTLTIGAGRIYVEGILCESSQPYLVMPAAGQTSGQTPSEPSNPGMSIVSARPGLAALAFAKRVDIAQQLNRSMLPQVALQNLSSATVTALASSQTGAASPGTSTPVQPYLPALPTVSSGQYYVAYLDVWERDITALEDPSIREIALGGADTTTRTRVIWQVKLAAKNGSACPTDLSGLLKLSSGQMSAQAAAGQTASNPCDIPASAAYRSLENQLYRVEVHTGGAAGTATFKWSRDNASVAVAWQGGDAASLAVSSLGRDDVLGFAGGQWVELLDDTHEYAGAPGTLVQLSNAQLVGQVPTLSLDTTTATGTTNFTDFPSTPKVRRWDQSATANPALANGAIPVLESTWMDLENGVQVYFQPGGYYNTGDYWLIPARTATTASQPTVLWPTSGNNPLPQIASGIRHHYAPLAVVTADGSKNWNVTCDCRSTFDPISTPAAVRVVSIQTAEKPPISLTPFLQIAPEHLLAGLRMTCDQPLSASALNVATFSISIDLPETDEKFAELATPGQQVPAAVAVKAMGYYSLGATNNSATWLPFGSARNYFLTKLAAFGVLTATQGLALVRINIYTSALRAAYCGGGVIDNSDIHSLEVWSQPYLDGSALPSPVFDSFSVIGPDSNGDYVAIGFMTSSAFKIMLSLPLPDVLGGKLYRSALTLKSATNVYAYVPTAAERGGDFSAFALPLIDPRTGGPFPGNRIPASLFPSAAAGAASGDGIFAWRFRAYVPVPTYYGYGYGYTGSTAVGGELI